MAIGRVKREDQTTQCGCLVVIYCTCTRLSCAMSWHCTCLQNLIIVLSRESFRPFIGVDWSAGVCRAGARHARPEPPPNYNVAGKCELGTMTFIRVLSRVGGPLEVACQRHDADAAATAHVCHSRPNSASVSGAALSVIGKETLPISRDNILLLP